MLGKLELSRRTKALFIAGSLALAVPATASAAPVNWVAQPLFEFLVDGPGQTVTDIAGIAGLDVTVTGSNNTSFVGGAMWFPGDNQLLLANNGGGGTRDQPVSITFAFSQKVNLRFTLGFFGDVGVQERVRFSSPDTTAAMSVSGASLPPSIVGLGTGSLEMFSPWQTAPIVSTGPVDTLSILVGGANTDFTGNAGVTFAMDVEKAPVTAVPLPASAWLLIAALGGLLGLARRSVA